MAIINYPAQQYLVVSETHRKYDCLKGISPASALFLTILWDFVHKWMLFINAVVSNFQESQKIIRLLFQFVVSLMVGSP